MVGTIDPTEGKGVMPQPERDMRQGAEPDRQSLSLHLRHEATPAASLSLHLLT